VSRPGGHVERTRVEDHRAALALIQRRHLGKAYVVANANANFAKRFF